MNLCFLKRKINMKKQYNNTQELSPVEGSYTRTFGGEAVVLMGEVAITRLGSDSMDNLLTPGVQTCVALGMLHPGKKIAVLGHFDSPANVGAAVDKVISILKKEYKLTSDDLKAFKAELVGGVVAEGFIGKVASTTCITDPIKERLGYEGITVNYTKFDTSLTANTNYCLAVNSNQVISISDQSGNMTGRYLRGLNSAQQKKYAQRMNEDPRWGNLSYDVSSLDALTRGADSAKKTTYTLKMNDEQYQAWRRENKAPSCCCVVM
jgi:hypothetical protein